MKLMAAILMMMALMCMVMSGCVSTRKYVKVEGERDAAVAKEKGLERALGVARETADFGGYLGDSGCEAERAQLRRMFTITTGEQRKARVDK